MSLKCHMLPKCCRLGNKKDTPTSDITG
jgi:hypothetical protein